MIWGMPPAPNWFWIRSTRLLILMKRRVHNAKGRGASPISLPGSRLGAFACRQDRPSQVWRLRLACGRTRVRPFGPMCQKIYTIGYLLTWPLRIARASRGERRVDVKAASRPIGSADIHNRLLANPSATHRQAEFRKQVYWVLLVHAIGCLLIRASGAARRPWRDTTMSPRSA